MVVTRYFGGIKLGFGGLSRAYRDTALSAIEEAGIVEVFEQTQIKNMPGICGKPESKKSDRKIWKNSGRNVLGYREIYLPCKKRA